MILKHGNERREETNCHIIAAMEKKKIVENKMSEETKENRLTKRLANEIRIDEKKNSSSESLREKHEYVVGCQL